jgi:PHD/YefM family antitoxin component YafN of YafNO toxin-antitoxin module
VRRIVLKESHAPYTLTLEEGIAGDEPLVLERDGQAVAVVIPLAEYEAFRAWRDASEQERESTQGFEALRQEPQAFLAKLNAIHDGLRTSGYRFGTKEEIDTQLEAERESWER